MAHTIFLITGTDQFTLRAIALHVSVDSEGHIGIAKIRTTRNTKHELDERFVRSITYLELLNQKSDRNVAWIEMHDGYTDAILHSTLRHRLKRKHLILVGSRECANVLRSHQYPVQIIHVTEPGKAYTSLPASWQGEVPSSHPTFHFEWIENNRALLLERLAGLMHFLSGFPITIHADEHGVVR